MANKHNVFVYGTLRPWEDGNYIPATHALPGYTMYSAGAFPYIVPGGARAVVGTILSVTDKQLKQLDKIEGLERGLYTREKAEVYQMDANMSWSFGSDMEECFVYVAGPLLLPKPIESGDWRQYQKQLYGV